MGTHGVATFRLGHRPGLDGLRGLAILLVMVGHSNVPWLFDDGGHVGVAVFFTLSGFLITALLLHERDDTGRVDLRAFYVRRALRLAPAIVTVGVFALALGVDGRHVAAALLYVSNFVVGSGELMFPLTHTWSLAVEEQFYLVWPAVFVAVRGDGRRLAVAGGLLVVCIVGWRFWYWTDVETSLRWVYNGPTRISGILTGCLLAVWFVRRGAWRPPTWLVAGAWAVLLGLATGLVDYAHFPYTMVAVEAAAVVVVAWAATVAPRWLQARWLTTVGVVSYGLYLWHYLVFALVPGDGAGRLAFVWTVSFAVAGVSWMVVERPALRLKRRWTRHTAAQEAPVAAAQPMP